MQPQYRVYSKFLNGRNCIIQIILGIVVTLSATFADGQTSNNEDIVYLKNGGVMHGRIIEQIPGKSVKIENNYGDILVYQMDDIEKIVAEPRQETDSTFSMRPVMKVRYLGLYRFGYFPNINESPAGNDAIISVSTIQGIYLGRYYSIGAGVEYEAWDNHYGATLPVFLDMREYFMVGIFTPFVFGDAGYEFRSGNILNSNVFLNVGVGGRLYTANSLGLWAELGYEYQPMQILAFNKKDQLWSGQPGFSARIGVSFFPM